MRTTLVLLVLALLPTAAASVDVRVDPDVEVRVEAKVDADLDVGVRDRAGSEPSTASESADGGSFRERCARAFARFGAEVGVGGSGLAVGAAGGLWLALGIARRFVLGG